MRNCLICLIVFVLLFLTACTQQDKAVRVLSDSGYTNIRLHGYDFFACSKDDFYSDKFTAISPNGHAVSGTVCSGLFFKGATIRFN